MIHGSADDGQTQGDVGGMAKALELQHRQALVMVHGKHGISLVEIFRSEQSVRRQWPQQVHALLPQPLEHRLDDIDFLAAHMPALAGMGVESSYQNAWLGDAELLLQVLM